jgi:hypothetical protein
MGEQHETEAAPVPTAEIEEGIPYTSEVERVLEEAVAEAPAVQHGEPPPAPPSPAAEEEVRTVTEGPENPRRGWWQRLIQS